MRTLAIILFLLIASSLFAEDLQIYENYTKQYGDYYKPNGEIQEYESYVPKHGSYLKQEGKKLQQYNNYVPEHGTYYDEDGQRYEDYVPVYGDRLEED